MPWVKLIEFICVVFTRINQSLPRASLAFACLRHISLNIGPFRMADGGAVSGSASGETGQPRGSSANASELSSVPWTMPSIRSRTRLCLSVEKIKSRVFCLLASKLV
jgi:hypothetical protein